MNIDQLIPPVLQPYKAWIVLALMIVVYIIRPSLPAPQTNSSWAYVFVFNVFDKIAGNFGNAAHTPENVPAAVMPAQLQNAQIQNAQITTTGATP